MLDVVACGEKSYKSYQILTRFCQLALEIEEPAALKLYFKIALDAGFF